MAVDNSAWDGAEAMSRCANADDPAAAYAAVCAGRREGDPALQSTWALPHHMSPMMGPNADGVRNSLSRLPQTDGLTNAEAALRHLEAHLAEIRDSARSEDDGVVISLELDAPVEVRSVAKREVDVRVVPWDTPIDTLQGRELFTRGAFRDVQPDDVLLMGLEHEAHLGLGQDGRPVLTRHPIGKATALDDQPDGQHATFRVAKTSAGDDFLALAEDRVVRGVSLEFSELPGGTVTQRIEGRRTRIHQRSALRAVAPTYRPAYREAEILAVRAEEPAEAEREDPVPETTPQEVPAAGTPDFSALEAMFTEQRTQSSTMYERILERLERVEEQNRSAIVVPAAQPEEVRRPIMGEWAKTVVRMLTGDRIPEQEYRALADVITTDNAGVVPPTYLTELIGVIDPNRPFLNSTRRLPTPDGMKLTVPKITQRPTAAVQSTQKTEVSSQATKITTVDFDAVTIAGAGDLSLQIIKKSTPSFLNLWMELLGEAYAAECEDQAILALIADMGGYHEAVALDPNDLNLGAAYIAAFDAMRRGPDTIWLSTEAVGAFIDAKATTTNQPLYSSLRTNATAAGGVEGTISGLRAVHVPALDAHSAFAIVGPSTGFAWAEDGTYTLQADVPGTAGRDVSLVGLLYPAPWYPAAFTMFNVAS